MANFLFHKSIQLCVAALRRPENKSVVHVLTTDKLKMSNCGRHSSLCIQRGDCDCYLAVSGLSNVVPEVKWTDPLATLRVVKLLRSQSVYACRRLWNVKFFSSFRKLLKIPGENDVM
jgi:hypothetical protein